MNIDAGPPKMSEVQTNKSNWRFSLKFGLIFCPKLGEEQKKKKRTSLKFGPIFCPKFGEEQKKRSSLRFGPLICPKSGTEKGHEKEKFGPKLDATTSTLPGPPSTGYDVPPSRRPWSWVETSHYKLPSTFMTYYLKLTMIQNYFLPKN